LLKRVIQVVRSKVYGCRLLSEWQVSFY